MAARGWMEPFSIHIRTYTYIHTHTYARTHTEEVRVTYRTVWRCASSSTRQRGFTTPAAKRASAALTRALCGLAAWCAWKASPLATACCGVGRRGQTVDGWMCFSFFGFQKGNAPSAQKAGGRRWRLRRHGGRDIRRRCSHNCNSNGTVKGRKHDSTGLFSTIAHTS